MGEGVPAGDRDPGRAGSTNPNEVRALEIREWLEKALDDLESTRVLATADHAANTLYHCPQTAEKALKGYLTWHDQPFRNTHNLKEPGESCALVDASLGQTAEEAHALTDYSWKMRYPGDPYIAGEGELSAQLALAARVRSEIESRLTGK